MDAILLLMAVSRTAVYAQMLCFNSPLTPYPTHLPIPVDTIHDSTETERTISKAKNIDRIGYEMVVIRLGDLYWSLHHTNQKRFNLVFLKIKIMN